MCRVPDAGKLACKARPGRRGRQNAERAMRLTVEPTNKLLLFEPVFILSNLPAPQLALPTRIAFCFWNKEGEAMYKHTECTHSIRHLQVSFSFIWSTDQEHRDEGPPAPPN